MPRAEITSKNTGASYSAGIYPASITNINVYTDKETMPFQNNNMPDHFIKFEFSVADHPGRTYDAALFIKLDKDSNNQLIAENAQIGRLFGILNALGYTGGYNPQGAWINCNDEVIQDENIEADIAEWLLKCAPEPIILAVYPQLNKKDGRSFMSSGWDFYPNTKEGLDACHKKYDKIIAKATSAPTQYRTSPTTSPATPAKPNGSRVRI